MTKQRAEVLQVLRPVNYDGGKRTLVVLGAPRGGTSMLSGALDKLGIYMGDKIGHQKEDHRFRQDTPLNTKLQAIADNNAVHTIWGWKLPNTIYYYEELHPHLVNPVFLTVYRNPFAVAASSARRDGRPLDQSLLRVPIDHYQKMHQMIAQFPTVPLATCGFENVSLANGEWKAAFIDQLIDFIGVDATPRRCAEAVAFIDYDKGYQN